MFMVIPFVLGELQLGVRFQFLVSVYVLYLSTEDFARSVAQLVCQLKVL
jgi:hypothetical protein